MRQAGQKWTLANLPKECNQNNMFPKRFVPTYFKLVAQGNDPWTIDGLVAVTTMQKIWTTVYGKTITCTISTDSPVFAIVSIFIYILHI